jgi:threonine dehydratase
MPGAESPDADAIRAAAQRLAGRAAATPLLSSTLVDARLGARLLIKAECLQRTGSFKFRGAYNALAQIEPSRRSAGVVAYSSGNHAQGVAAAAALLGIPAIIVMPADAPAIKIDNTRAYGAEVVLYDRYAENREAIGARIARERDATLLPPYDDVRVVAGQGTVGLEIAQEAATRGIDIDAVVVSCSGGGLISGCAIALAAASPATKIYSAEPAGHDDMRRSLLAGHRVANDAGPRSICDALLAPIPGEITFPIAQRYLAGGISVDDDEVRAAMCVAFEDYKLVVEPGGAAALAAVIAGKIEIAGRTIVAIASGGNVDPAAFAKIIGD